MDKIREGLAALEHEQWAHWTKYMLYNSTDENMIRWLKQVKIPYSELSEKEKDSDREWADKVIDFLGLTISEDITTDNCKKGICCSCCSYGC